ncbi:hemerythrin domain-containing protein [Gloeothece verrucosa]|uniref:Hemerythrin HHE cation binding domain protein n=1 Tax=Gloeothece verrucosa (strain PCC 7822) TaxID=497965 RepID=E0UEA9_GLOV7|nr:hemerythrin domain-containing protein [Gloeothece verrucosa]ADN14234.1 Hemerythrin HHE cation binding domain protein [Gloeothece verrucosa PCC 7822]
MAKVKNILDLIEEDHRKVEKLLQEIEKTKDPQKSQEIFKEIYKELNLHAQAEELVFYPAMQEYEETKQYIEEAEQEHISAEIILEQLTSISAEDSEFSTKIQDLKQQVKHHVEEEEKEIFAAVRQYIDEQELEQMGKKFQATKLRLAPNIEVAMA